MNDCYRQHGASTHQTLSSNIQKGKRSPEPTQNDIKQPTGGTPMTQTDNPTSTHKQTQHRTKITNKGSPKSTDAKAAKQQPGNLQITIDLYSDTPTPNNPRTTTRRSLKERQCGGAATDHLDSDTSTTHKTQRNMLLTTYLVAAQTSSDDQRSTHLKPLARLTGTNLQRG